MVHRIELRADERIFTLFCALNATGYDKKGRLPFYHPTRRRVRAELRQADAAIVKEMRSWFKEHRAHPCYYASYVLSLSDLPELRETPRTQSLLRVKEFEPLERVMVGFAECLSKFYQAADVPLLWHKYRPAYLAEIEAWRPWMAAAIAQVDAYLRLGTSRDRRVVFIPNLLMPYLSGYGPWIGDTVYVVSGPTTTLLRPIAATFLVQHEYTHSTINPLVALNQALVDRLAPLFAIVESELKRRGHGCCEAMVIESLLLAVGIRLSVGSKWLRRQALSHQLGEGYILVGHFMRGLERFEQGTQTIAEFVPQMLRSVDVDQIRAEYELASRRSRLGTRLLEVMILGASLCRWHWDRRRQAHARTD